MRGVPQASLLTFTLALPPAAPILPAILPKRAAGSTCHTNVRDGGTLGGHKMSPLPGIKRTRTEFHCCCVSCTDGTARAQPRPLKRGPDSITQLDEEDGKAREGFAGGNLATPRLAAAPRHQGMNSLLSGPPAPNQTHREG